MKGDQDTARLGIPLSVWRDAANHIELKGHRIAYWTAGEGEPLVLIHGFPTAAWDWNYLWGDLAARFKVIALDLLGFGYSAKPWPHSYRIAEQADLVTALTAFLDAPNFHLLAHDYGDTVAQELLARHNETTPGTGRVKSLCLLNGGLFPEAHRPVFVQKLLLSPIGGLLTGFLSKRTIQKNLTRIFGVAPPTPAEIDAFWALIGESHGRRVIPGLLRYIPERTENRARWVGALQETTVPIRFVNGTKDPISGGHMAARYSSLIPGPDVVRLEGVGHYPQVEAPKRVLASFLEFHGLTGVSPE